MYLNRYFKSVVGNLLVATCISSSLQASVEKTVEEVTRLTEEGKNVAIMIIDMQPRFVAKFNQDDFMNIIDRQCQLMAQLTDNENVHFIEVDYMSTEGYLNFALSGLREHMIRRTNYALTVKAEDSAFGYGYTTHIEIYGNPHDPEYNRELDAYVEISTIEEYLEAKTITHLVPTGCFSGMCIAGTAQSALKKGFSVIADRDLMITHNIERFKQLGEPPEELERKTENLWRTFESQYPNTLTRIRSSDVANQCDI